MRARPSVLAVIAAGAIVGASARYGVARRLPTPPGGFPWATFWTNVSGSFALGAVLVVIARRFPAATHLRALLATGFLGAYTTYSTFAVETDVLVKDGHLATALTYATASLAVGLAAVAVGMALGMTLARRLAR